MKTHEVGNRMAIVHKSDGKWIQVVFIPSAWENQYYVILENLENIKHICGMLTKEEIIQAYPNVTNKLFYK